MTYNYTMTGKTNVVILEKTSREVSEEILQEVDSQYPKLIIKPNIKYYSNTTVATFNTPIGDARGMCSYISNNTAAKDVKVLVSIEKDFRDGAELYHNGELVGVVEDVDEFVDGFREEKYYDEVYKGFEGC